jgi:hypothetical protein
VSGEPVPAAAFEQPAELATITERLVITLTASSPRGIGSAELRLAANGREREIPLTAEWLDASNLRARFGADVEAWPSGNGEAVLIARIIPATAPLDPVEIRRRVRIEIPAATMEIRQPSADESLVRGDVEALVRFASPVPVERVTGRFGEESVSPEVTWDSPAHLAGTGAVRVPTTNAADGPRVLEFMLEDAMSRSVTAQRRLLVENATFELGPLMDVTMSPMAPRDLFVDFTKKLAAPPTLTLSDSNPRLVAGDAVPVAEGLRWKFPLSAVGSGVASAAVRVSGTDGFGDTVSGDLVVHIDAQAPRLLGALEERRTPTGTTLTLVCDEPARHLVRFESGATQEGDCPRSPGALPVASRVASVRVTDELGNSAEFVPSLVIEERAPIVRAVAVTRGDAGPMKAIAAPAGAAVDTDAKLTSIDGLVREIAVSAVSAPAGSALRAQPAGPLRQTSRRPIAFRDEGVVKLLVPEGQGHSWWALQPDGGATNVTPILELSEAPCPPAWDPARRVFVGARGSELIRAGLRGERATIRPISAQPQELRETLVCGDLFVGAGISPNAQAGGFQLALFVAELSLSGAAAPPQLQAMSGPGTVRLTCDGTDPIVFAGTEAELQVWRYGAERAWTRLTPARQPTPRSDYMTSADGLFGGGRRGATIVDDLWRFSGGTFTLLRAEGSGPARANAAIMEEGPVGSSRVLVIGGEARAGLSTLVASSATTPPFRETPYLAPTLASWGQTWDPVRRALVVLGPTPTDQRSIWEWSGSSGWRERVTGLPARAGAHVIYLPQQQQSLVFGGFQGPQSATYRADELRYQDGSVLGTSPTTLRAAYGHAGAIADGRVALVRPETSTPGLRALIRSPNGSWFNASATLNTVNMIVAQVSEQDAQWGTLIQTSEAFGMYRWSLVSGPLNTTTNNFDTQERFVFDGLGPVLTLPWAPDRFLDGAVVRSVAEGGPVLGQTGLPEFVPADALEFLAIGQHVLPPPAKRMMIAYPSRDPPVWEVSDEVSPGLYAELPAGELEVDLCASSDQAVSTDIAAWIVTEAGIEDLPSTQHPSGCEGFAIRRTSAAKASLFVTAAGGSESVRLRVDQLRIRTLTRR